MSALARINGSELALHSLKKTPKNLSRPSSKFGRSGLASLEKEMCNEHYNSQCRCQPGQLTSMEWRRRLGRCARAQLPLSEIPAVCSESPSEPRDLSFPLASFSAMGSIKVIPGSIAGRMLLMPWTMRTTMMINALHRVSSGSCIDRYLTTVCSESMWTWPALFPRGIWVRANKSSKPAQASRSLAEMSAMVLLTLCYLYKHIRNRVWSMGLC